MKLLIALAFCGFVVAMPGCRSRDRSTVVKEANTAILLEPPYTGITDSIHASPKDHALYLRRAEMLSEARQYELAYADLTKAWAISPSQSTGEYQVNMLFMAGKNEQAVNLLQALSKQYPDNINFKRRMAEALLQNKQFVEALAIYNKIIAADSTDFEAFHERALISLEDKDTLTAITDLEHSFRLQPLQLTAVTLANLYAEEKNPRALELADLVISKDSAKELIDPVFIKGVYYGNIKNYPRALELFTTCIKMDWKFQDAYIEKGIIYFEQNNLDEALQQFKLAATVSNTYPDAYFWQGRCYEALGKSEEALANYARAYALDRDFTEAVDAAKRVKEKNRGG
jgi:tetratricopeptide (TPR) repeat protein